MTMRIYRRYAPSRRLVLQRSDCIQLLRSLPPESIDLTVTSPPYCIGKEYEVCQSAEDFVQEHERVLPRIVELTKPGGHVCWQVGYHVKDNAIVPLDFLVHQIMCRFPDMTLRNRIIWTFGHGSHLSKRFSGRHEIILWYSKGKDYYFDLDSVRTSQKYPGKKHYKGPKKGQFSGNPLGKNPSDVWDIPNVKSAHVEKTEHPCQFPVALAQRLIRSLSPPSGIVLDPYSGSGSTGVAALIEKRGFLGSENNRRYCDIAEERFRDALNGTTKMRPFDKPIYVPNNEAVAKKPSHFI